MSSLDYASTSTHDYPIKDSNLNDNKPDPISKSPYELKKNEPFVPPECELFKGIENESFSESKRKRVRYQKTPKKQTALNDKLKKAQEKKIQEKRIAIDMLLAFPAGYAEKYNNRNWAAYTPKGEIICVTLYKKGVREVLRRLSEKQTDLENKLTTEQRKKIDLLLTFPAGYVEKYDGRNWAVYTHRNEIICVTLYKKGAQEVLRRLSEKEKK